MTARRQIERGFTLAETLVALLILGLVSAVGSGLLIGASSSSKQVREREAVLRQLDLAQALLRSDIGAMSVRAVVPDDGFSRAGNLFGGAGRGDEPLLRFVRNGWIDPGGFEARSGLQYVAYRLDTGQLIREVTLRPDAVEATPRVSQVLLDGVSAVDLRFLRGGEWSAQWIGDAGQSLTVMPDLIEVVVRFEDETQLTLSALTGARS